MTQSWIKSLARSVSEGRGRSFRDRPRKTAPSVTDTPSTERPVIERPLPRPWADGSRPWAWSTDPLYADPDEFSDDPEDDHEVLMAHVRSCRVDGFCPVCQCL